MDQKIITNAELYDYVHEYKENTPGGGRKPRKALKIKSLNYAEKDALQERINALQNSMVDPKQKSTIIKNFVKWTSDVYINRGTPVTPPTGSQYKKNVQ